MPAQMTSPPSELPAERSPPPELLSSNSPEPSSPAREPPAVPPPQPSPKQPDAPPSAIPAQQQPVSLPSEVIYGGLLHASSLRTAFIGAVSSLFGLAAAAFVAGCLCSRASSADAGASAPSKGRKGFHRLARREPSHRYDQPAYPHGVPHLPSRLWLGGRKPHGGRGTFPGAGRQYLGQYYSEVSMEMPPQSQPKARKARGPFRESRASRRA